MSGGPRVKLTFPEDLITQPVIARLAREKDVLANIRRANVEEKVGWIVCELEGAPADVDAALVWLAGLGVEVDLLDQAVEG